MIRSFGDAGTEDIYNGANTKAARRALPVDLQRVAQRKLDRINRAKELRDLRDPPANRLESLRGNWAGYYSLRINDQYRVGFQFAGGDALDVRIVDYH